MKYLILIPAILLSIQACKNPKDGSNAISTHTKVVDISAERADCENGARRYITYDDQNGNFDYDVGEEIQITESCFNDDVPPTPLPPTDPCPAEYQDNVSFDFGIKVGHSEVQSRRIQALIPGIIDFKAEKQIIDLELGTNTIVCEDDLLIKPEAMVLDKVDNEKIKYDIVFITDNSGSMFYNWFAIRPQMTNYVNSLVDKGIDFKVGFVGYNEAADITGAVNLNDGDQLLTFLESFGGIKLENGATFFLGNDKNGAPLGEFKASLNQENAIPSIIYAKNHFSFREGSQKIYINITNEFMVTNEPKGDSDSSEPFVPDSETPYTPEKFCATWNVAKDGFIHTLWMGDVITDDDLPNERLGNPILDENGEYQFKKLENGTQSPTELTKGNCGQGIREVQQHNFVGSIEIPRQQGIPELDLTTLLVTEAFFEISRIQFITQEKNKSHKLEIFVKKQDGKIGRGLFNGPYSELIIGID